eukprot:scaffold263104_cov17-Tisochrysis_lutea.AAC.2
MLIKVLSLCTTGLLADIVEGRTASRKSLNDPSQAEITAEVLAFWKFLGSKLAKDGSLPDGGRRIDLVGCRYLLIVFFTVDFLRAMS